MEEEKINTINTNNNNNNRLILHFDVNKTLIACDPAGNDDLYDTLNGYLSEISWINLNNKNEFIPYDLNNIHFTSPIPHDNNIINYSDYLYSIGRYINKKKFTEKNYPGHIFRSYFNYLLNQLNLPEPRFGGTKNNPNPKPNTTRLPIFDIYQDGKYFILPSFFNFLIKLWEDNREFKILFRTFGSDSHEIIEEFNLFCDDLHPFFTWNKLDLNNNDNINKYEENKLFWEEKKIDPIEHHAIFKRKYGAENLNKRNIKLEFHNRTIIGIDNILNTFDNEIFPGLHSFSIQDDFNGWDCGDTTGKLLVIDHNEDNVHQIFFDDNINHNNPYIIDIRSRHDLQPINFQYAKNRFLKKVEPILAILNPNYFYDALMECENNHNDHNNNDL